MIYNDVCRCCEGKNLHQYLDLGEQPLANSYHKGDTDQAYYPLKVNVCQDCWHSQLSVVVGADIMFSNYLYVSGTTITFRKHCENLAKDAMSRIDKPNPRVLDVACNDGTLLEYFREEGADVLGVDPAQNLLEITRSKNIPVEVAYWGSDNLDFGLFDIITGTNVFAHVHSADVFLEDCLRHLSDDGVLILEFPYCNEFIKKCEFDTVYHEHLSYFLVSSFSVLAFRCGFGVVDIMETPIHGGSIRFFMQKNVGHASIVSEMIGKERESGLLDLQAYVNFSETVEANKKDMRDLMDSLKGKRVIGYGASAKGNTMLNHFGLDLDYIVDDNEMKYGYKTPGRNISICSPDVLAEEKEAYVVILAWNFFDEIRSKIERIAGRGHHYIKYVPKVSIENG